jgi:hypothetical protein
MRRLLILTLGHHHVRRFTAPDLEAAMVAAEAGAGGRGGPLDLGVTP